MSQAGRKRNRRTAAAAPHPEAHPVERHGKGTAIALTAAVIILILAIAGAFTYPTYIGPFRRTVISVDKTNIRMDYFLKRIKLTGSDPISMLTQITNDQMVKLGAPRYGISATPEDTSKMLRAMVQGSSGNVSEAEFNEWYRQRLNESGLSDTEFRELVSTELLKAHLQEYLAARMPTVAEQVHLYVITLETQRQAERARARWAAGEKFTDLAKELSLDESTREKGGELGWFPRGGILTPQIEFEAFELSTENVSQPLPIISEQQQPEGGSAATIVGYNLLLVTKRAQRELDENSLRVLRSQVLEGWLIAERQSYNIKWYGLNNDAFDSETYAWINYQLAKSKPKSTSGSSGQPSQKR